MARQSNVDFIHEAKKRCREAEDGWFENFRIMIEDLEFAGGEQWPEEILRDREADGRPCLVINKMNMFIDQVIGDQRQNRSSVKVRAVDSSGDPQTAEVFNGLIRNIEQVSDADVARDTAAQAAVECGYGVYRIITEYARDDMFEQDIRFKRMKNQFAVLFDPMAQEITMEDARYCFITEDVDRAQFAQMFPGKHPMEWTRSLPEEHLSWCKQDTVRIAEYFYKVPRKKTISEVRLPSGATSVFDEDMLAKQQDYEIVRQRQVDGFDVMWCKMDGTQILEKRQKWPGKYIPVIPVFGKELNIQRKTIYRGLIRHAKDAQRLYNYNRSLGAETVALAPKSPYLATPKMIESHEKQWNQANKKNYPYLLFNVDPQMPAPPKREVPNQVQTGIVNEVMVADQEMHDTTSIPLAGVGKASNERSGKAIMARQREGDVATFPFMGSQQRAKKHEARILIDLIPKIYDTARVVRVLNEDGTDMDVPVNQEVQAPDGRTAIFDLTVGKYDVHISVGPSYTTQRQEAVDAMIEFIRVFPDAAPILVDIIAKNMDWPGAEEITKRFQALIAQQGNQQPSPEEQVKFEQEKQKLDNMQLDFAKKEVDIKKGQLEIQKMQTEEVVGRSTQ